MLIALTMSHADTLLPRLLGILTELNGGKTYDL